LARKMGITRSRTRNLAPDPCDAGKAALRSTPACTQGPEPGTGTAYPRDNTALSEYEVATEDRHQLAGAAELQAGRELTIVRLQRSQPHWARSSTCAFHHTCWREPGAAGALESQIRAVSIAKAKAEAAPRNSQRKFPDQECREKPISSRQEISL
jgi:hypothetical protein